MELESSAESAESSSYPLPQADNTVIDVGDNAIIDDAFEMQESPKACDARSDIVFVV